MDPVDMAKKMLAVARALQLVPGKVNAEVSRLLPTAAGAVRNPAIYAELMVQAWEAMRADAVKNPDVNRALLGMARSRGDRVTHIRKHFGSNNANFFRDSAGPHQYFVDLPF